MGIDSGYGIGSVKPGVCTSTTRPASPFDGQTVYMTDVDQTAVWDGSAWVVLAPIASGRNVVINGGFDIWQRGTSSTVTGNTYLADRWVRQSQAGATQEQSTDVPTGQGFRYSWKNTASATNTYMQMGQQIEFVNCKHLQNKTVHISFWAKAINSNGGSTGLTVRTRTNSTVDAQTFFSATASDTSVTLTTSWAKYTVSRTLPSTFGALSLEFALGSHVSGDGFLLTGVQMELGAVATPFEFEDFGTTLSKCQRYYQKSYSLPTNPATATTDGIVYNTCSSNPGNDFVMRIELRVEMRTGPTVTLYNTAGGSGTWTYTRSGVAETATTMANVYHTTNGFCVYGGVGAAYVVCQAYGHYVASAEL